jgi:hypothetical protein
MNMVSLPRLMATGYREAGCVEFRLTIYGNSGRELPPAALIASLLEFRLWIAQAQDPSRGAPPASGGPPSP